MYKLEQFIVILLGYLIFEDIYIRIGFFLNSPINKFTLILSFIIYISILFFLYSTNLFKFKQKFKRYIPIIAFIGVSLFFAGVSLLLSNTYDTSWDGQGYHQSAVIALANDWNPAYQPSIQFEKHLPSQIFAEAYPSSLNELEASIYILTNKINSAKVMNVVILFIAMAIVYCLLRKLAYGKILSIFISIFVAFQPVYIIQLLTFMDDGFSYELLLIVAASLAIFTLYSKKYWAIATFLMAEILLVSVKYSNLPIAFALEIFFLLVIINRFLNKEYVFNKHSKIFIVTTLLISLLFAYVPYGKNYIFHKALFYPTNIPSLMGSVKYNNVPLNLQTSNNASLLFYGIFSKSQSEQSGDPRNKSNIADLKIPFTFSQDEVNASAGLYNNRVGGGGPFFSGIVLLSLLLLFFLYFRTKNIKERYCIYTCFFVVTFILLLSLFVPAPNLLRYVNQLQILPFAIIIPILTIFKNSYIKVYSLIILSIIGINLTIFSYAVFYNNLILFTQINNQFQSMRDSNKVYQVGSEQFYSSYIILTEQHVPFIAITDFKCHGIQRMIASSNTTHYCLN